MPQQQFPSQFMPQQQQFPSQFMPQQQFGQQSGLAPRMLGYHQQISSPHIKTKFGQPSTPTPNQHMPTQATYSQPMQQWAPPTNQVPNIMYELVNPAQQLMMRMLMCALYGQWNQSTSLPEQSNVQSGATEVTSTHESGMTLSPMSKPAR
jgi:hypothetical protein